MTRYGKPVIFLVAALLAAAAPVGFGWPGSTPMLHEAFAKDGKGNDGGGGKGRDGKSGDNGKSESRGSKGRSGVDTTKAANSVVGKEVTKDSVQIRYRNGYREQVAKGRFIMKDAKGRTIIDRRATTVDRVRLWLKRAIP